MGCVPQHIRVQAVLRIPQPVRGAHVGTLLVPTDGEKRPRGPMRIRLRRLEVLQAGHAHDLQLVVEVHQAAAATDPVAFLRSPRGPLAPILAPGPRQPSALPLSRGLVRNILLRFVRREVQGGRDLTDEVPGDLSSGTANNASGPGGGMLAGIVSPEPGISKPEETHRNQRAAGPISSTEIGVIYGHRPGPGGQSAILSQNRR